MNRKIKMLIMLCMAVMVVAVSGIIASPVQAASRKEVKSCMSSYAKLKKTIGNIYNAPARLDPSDGDSGQMFINKKGEYEGIHGYYSKSTGKISMFENTYRKDISLYSIYIGMKSSLVKAKLAKSHFKRISHETYSYGTSKWTIEFYKYGKKAIQVNIEGGKVTSYCYYYNRPLPTY